MGVSFEQDYIRGCVPGIIGFDFQDQRAQHTLERWYDYTKNREEASFSFRQESVVFSVVLYQLGLIDSFMHMDGKVTWQKEEISKEGMWFFVDKYLVQPNWPYE